MATILIVEDNEKNMRLANDVLVFGGFETLLARTAEEGLALAAAERPDAILMDIQLPGIDGVQALAALRANPTTAPIPVAAITAFAMESDRRRLLAAGFDLYISKPIEIDRFAEQVGQLCARPKASP